MGNIVSVWLKSTYFRFQDKIYDKIDGISMGSPFSLVITNLYMEILKKQALESSPLKPK